MKGFGKSLLAILKSLGAVFVRTAAEQAATELETSAAKDAAKASQPNN